MRNGIILLILAGILSACQASRDDQAIQYLAEGFADPPVEARPRALWDWVDGNFELSEITREMEEAKKMGMGGFDIWDVRSVVDEEGIMPAGPPFMSDAYLEGIVHAISEAERIGLDLGLIVASGWNAGGAWTRPEHQTMGIFFSEIRTEGGAVENRVLPFPELPDMAGKPGRQKKAIIPRGNDGLPQFYKDIAVLAVRMDSHSGGAGPGDSVSGHEGPSVIDLSADVNSDRRLNTTLPPGQWSIIRYVCTNTGQPMISSTPNSTGPMIDHFNAEATEIHINYFIDRLEEALGKPVAESGLDYLYTDSYEVQGQLWTPALAEEFEERTGYSLLPYLPMFSGQEALFDQQTRRRFMYDFRKVLSDLIIENHYKKATDICEQHGISFVAEAAGPGYPIHNCPFESIKSSGALSFPRGEFWHLPVKTDFWRRMHETDSRDHYLHDLQVIKGVASASHLYGQKYVEAEAFTGTHLWVEAPGDLKATADRAFCEGLNRINFHTWPHTPEEAGEPGWVYAFGTLVNETRIWWPKSRAWMDYLARCSFMLQQGNFIGDALFFYGDSAPNFVPPKQFTEDLGYGFDYDYINTEKLLELEVKDGKLSLENGQAYELLVLPDEDYMVEEVLQKVAGLLESGAAVLGPRPVKGHGLNDWVGHDERVKKLADALWGSEQMAEKGSAPVGEGTLFQGISTRQALTSLGVQPDVDFTGNTNKQALDFIHRQTDEVDIYMIRNRTDTPLFGEAKFRVQDKTPAYWDPATGDMRTCDVFRQSDGYTSLPVTLGKYGSMFIVFSPGVGDDHYTGIQLDGQPVFPHTDMARTDMSAIWVSAHPESGFMLTLPGFFRFTGPAGTSEFVNPYSAMMTGVEGPWWVSFPEENKGPGVITMEELYDWTKAENPAIRYFSGIATYRKSIAVDVNSLEAGERYLLDLGEVADLADLYINDRHVRTLWEPVKYADITDFLNTGENTLQIDVANTWHNQLIADARRPADERITRSNVVRLPNAWAYRMDELPSGDYGLQEAGMIGPVLLVKTRSLKLF